MDASHNSGQTPNSRGETTRIVTCPTCGGESLYGPSNSARPFCSERCKNMDFGAWASENFRVATPEEPDDLGLDNPPLQ